MIQTIEQTQQKLRIKMFQAKVHQKFPLPVVLIVLLILQVACISISYSINFDDYIVSVVIVLSLLIAYFAYHYLNLHFQRTKYFQTISEVTSTQDKRSHTQKQVEKLIKTEEFKQFEQKWRNKQLIKSGAQHKLQSQQQEQTNHEDVQGVIDELLQNEDKIFDL